MFGTPLTRVQKAFFNEIAFVANNVISIVNVYYYYYYYYYYVLILFSRLLMLTLIFLGVIINLLPLYRLSYFVFCSYNNFCVLL
jgi:hypothetical protein